MIKKAQQGFTLIELMIVRCCRLVSRSTTWTAVGNFTVPRRVAAMPATAAATRGVSAFTR